MGLDSSIKNLSDENLVQEIVKDNNSLLFSVLYDRYDKIVYNKCYSFSKSKDEAEDLTQDVFLKLFVKLNTFKGKSKFSTWLYSFTYNFCANYVNRDRHRKISGHSSVIDENFDDFGYEVAEDDFSSMKAKRLKEALEIIDAEDKSILLLKYQDDVSIKELEILLDIGSSAVKMRLKRARVKIMKIYNELN
ncbi:MAG: RNA polymerase sigma factor [Cellulophaga sp.]